MENIMAQARLVLEMEIFTKDNLSMENLMVMGL